MGEGEIKPSSVCGVKFNISGEGKTILYRENMIFGHKKWVLVFFVIDRYCKYEFPGSQETILWFKEKNIITSSVVEPEPELLAGARISKFRLRLPAPGQLK